MRVALLVLLLLATSCKRAGPEKTVLAAWEKIEASQSACPNDYDYFPGGGMRAFWCHLETLVPYKGLERLAGVPVFVSGPHTGAVPSLTAERAFGHYNPAFVRWLVDHAVPGAKDSAVRARTQTAYDETMRERARTYLAASLFLRANPTYRDDELAWYRAFVAGEHDGRPQDRHGRAVPASFEGDLSPAVAFWLRRSLDGTAPLFEEGLTRLLTVYDEGALEELAALSWQRRPEAPPTPSPAAADAPLDTLVREAWSRLGTASFESNCPEQFEYTPGGVRVAYCKAKHVLDFAALVAKAPMPVFLEGPHSATALKLSEERSFGHYNPELVRWLLERAIPAALDAGLKESTRAAYDEHLRVPARAFWYARRLLEHQPEKKMSLRSEYAAYIDGRGGDLSPRHAYWELIPEGETYEAQAIAGTAIAFWLRRSLDGTEQLFSEALRKVLATYDEDFLRQTDELTWRELSPLFGSLTGGERAEDIGVHD